MEKLISQDVSFCNGINNLAESRAKPHIGNRNKEPLNQIEYRGSTNVKIIRLILVKIRNFTF